MPSPRPRLLFAQPSIQPPGGGHGVAAWLLAALEEDFEITLAVEDPPDLDAVNGYYGTSLAPARFVFPAPGLDRFRSWKRLLDRLPFEGTRLRRAAMLRWYRRIAKDFDVVLGVRNEIDIGRPVIQYVHRPYRYFSGLPFDRPTGRFAVARRAYIRFAEWLGGESFERIRSNLTLANSEWTRDRFLEVYGSPANVEILYPPVQGEFPAIPWDQRMNSFICLGRIAPAKNIDRMIRILDRVREAGHEVGFDIVGSVEDPEYHLMIRGMAAARPWVKIHLDAPRKRLPWFIAVHRYGIHGMDVEPFGMAVAEMALAGCVVFVPDGGGQVEIVDRDERLVHRSVEDAAAKIIRVLEDENLREELRTKLVERAKRFTLDAFMRRARELVLAFFESRKVKSEK